MTLSSLDLAQKLCFFKENIKKLDCIKTINGHSLQDSQQNEVRSQILERNVQFMKQLYLEYIKNSQS